MVRNLRRMLGATTTGLFLTLAGCSHCHKQCATPQVPPPPVIVPAAPVPAPTQFTPGPPPGAQPANPNIRGYPPYEAQQQPQAAWPQNPQSQSQPQPQPNWQPAPGARLGSPRFESPEPPAAVREQPSSDRPVMPGASDRPSGSPSLPVGIPRFNKVTDQVAAGQQPFDEGYDWLKENSYRTVLQIRAPGQDDSADRQQAEKRGLRYLSLELSPDTLAKVNVEEFTRIVDDRANQPLFVFDRDSSLAGALWYLYFRGPVQLPDAKAREKAAQLGLKDNGSDEQKLLWLAIQKYLSDQGK